MSDPRRAPGLGAFCRAICWAFALVFVLLVGSRRSWAADPSRVLIVRPELPGALLAEALIRTRGELGAVGFSLEERLHDGQPLAGSELGPDVYGALAFEELGSVVRISAWSADARAPLVQAVDTAGTGMDAEVIAVRAVETLRAAMLRFTQDVPPERRLPQPVRGFTKTADAELAGAAPRRRDAVAPPKAERGGALNVWIGPSLLLAELPSDLGWGAQAGVFYGKAWYSAGAAIEAALVPTRYTADAGTADVRRTLALASFRSRLLVDDSSLLSAGVGAGVASYSVQGRATPGFRADPSSHESAVVALELGAAHWPLEHLGAYLSLRGSVALDAAVIRIDERAMGTLDRPALSLSVGVIVGRR